MLMVISPAKKLDFDSSFTIKPFSDADFLEDAEELIGQLRELTPPGVSELMKISDKLGDLNFGRYLNWDKNLTLDNARQALLAFKGDVYIGIDADSMTEKDLQWAQDRLRILSGLYGLLRPLDLIKPYRLEMGTRFANHRGKDLYEFWGSKITDSLNKALASESHPTVVNLASNEYFKSINIKGLNAEVITPVFKDWKGEKYKIISFYAKKARGLMVGYAIRKRIEDVEKLKQFDGEGYCYNPAMSSAREWVFTRDPQDV
ncbi:MAG: peroxide stress protein YaaA [Gammaproteobacteria bacterium]|nr:MAG: peroxide stress protein YaaA [Gammaproteobacteria bacterium]